MLHSRNPGNDITFQTVVSAGHPIELSATNFPPRTPSRQDPPSSAELFSDKQRKIISLLPSKTQSRLNALAEGATPFLAQCEKQLRSLTALPQFAELSPALQARIFEAFVCNSKNPQRVTQAVPSLLSCIPLHKLQPSEEVKLFDLYLALPTVGKNLALRSLSIPDPLNRSPLFDYDSRGTTLLAHLHGYLASPNPQKMIEHGITKADVLLNVLAEALNPAVINQGDRKTCGVASIQYMLCRENPAEYARLVFGLVTTGRVALRNGDTCEINASGIRRDNSARTDSERIFQSSLMEYANGDHYVYLNDSDKHIKTSGRRKDNGIAGLGGLTDRQVTRALKGIFDRDYRQDFVPEAPATSLWRSAVARIWGHTEDYKVVVSEHLEALEGALERLKTTSEDTLAIALYWSPNGEHRRHVVVFDRYENGRFHFRNPWGWHDLSRGTELLYPPRRVEDGPSGFESMTEEDLRKHLCTVWYTKPNRALV